jgi:hypothetical protein
MKYYYKYQREKKLSPKLTRLASVKVFNYKDKEIGHATLSKWQKVEDVVNMLIREHEISKVWNNPKLSFNKK